MRPASNPYGMDQLKQLAERLVRFRTQAGMDVESAAAGAAIDVDRLARAEEGTVALNEAEIGRLADTYGVDPTELFGGRFTPLQNYA